MTGNNLIDQIEPSNLSPQDYVKLVYITLLQRKVDDVGFGFWEDKIKSGTFKPKELIDTIYNSPEFIMHYKVPFNTVLHQARQIWIKTLDKFDYVFDIGGSSPNIAEGALIEMGYEGRPQELIIFDLPEEEQYWGKPKFSQNQDYNYKWGVIKYEHGYIENINEYSELNVKKFDMVFMGQVIEHIQKDKLKIVLTWIKEHLNKGGKFIFDTPNRDITKIQNPRGFIDKDHKHEYAPIELEQILSDNGFQVIKKVGLLNMPNTYKSKQFNPLEIYDTEIVNNCPETSYVFACECTID